MASRWRTRSVAALTAAILVMAGCGGDDDDGDASSDAAADSGTGGTASSAGDDTDSGGGGGAGGEKGSASIEITGGVDQSETLPFQYEELNGQPALSMFTNGGWLAYFGADGGSERVLQLNTAPGSEIVNYGEPGLLVSGTSTTGCAFSFDQNDEDGLVGSFDCRGLTAFVNETDTETVDFSGTFDAHP